MKIVILAIGTRGDIQPLAALGAALLQSGRHAALLVAPDDFAPLAHETGLSFAPLGIEVRRLLGAGALRAFVEPGGSILLGMVGLLRSTGPLFEAMMENSWQACQGADAIVFSTLGLGGYHIAERLQVPCFQAVPFPGAPTGAFPSMVFPELPLGRGYNRLTYLLGNQAVQLATGRFFNHWRERRLGLPPLPLWSYPYGHLHGQPVPKLFSYSPLVFPKPPDWGEESHVTGYWFLDPPTGWQPPAGLVAFLAAGPPPVYIGFGSLPHRDAQHVTRLVVEALRQAGQRGVLATGWGGLSSAGAAALPGDVYMLETVPHAWLFPRMAAVVHHGGSGTTGAGLRAGIPGILLPHTGDQPHWARRLVELGVSPPCIPFRQLSAEKLAAAISQAVADKDLQSRAAALGERIRAEDGLARAMAVIETGLPGRL